MQYFAGANTKNGFVSFFDKTFENAERLYIIKGSCGCGKSTLMKKIASKASENGHAVEKIYCSGDVSSLDGVIIPELKIAVCDGTAPHLMDVKYPCVRESIINLGEFHKPQTLLPHRDEIISLTDEKSSHYAAAYRALAAAGKLRESAFVLSARSVEKKQLATFADRVVKRRAGAVKGEKRVLIASAFTKDGLKVLPAFGKVDTLFVLTGGSAVQSLFLQYAAESAQKHSVGHIISLKATDTEKYDSLFLPQSGTLFTSLSEPPCGSYNAKKTLNLSRFIASKQDQETKNRERLLARIAKECEAQAEYELKLAGDIHQRLEKIYIDGMDFKTLDAYTEALLKKIF